MRRARICVTVVVLLAGRIALTAESNHPPGALDVRQAARHAFQSMAATPPKAEKNRRYERMRRILDVLAREGIPLADILHEDDPQTSAARQGVSRVFTAARKTAASSLSEPADRVAAVRILGRGPDRHDDDLKLLATLLIPQSPLEVQLAAVDTISRLPHERVSEVLLSGWTKHGPTVHTAVVSVLLWREPWPGVLEEGSGHRPELVAAMDWAFRDIALRHPSAATRARAEKLRRTPRTKPEIRAALGKFFPALTMQGDNARGKATFTEATCANCHKVEDVGRHVGPDLSRLVDRSPRTLLVDTIDPNRVVDHRFIEFTALTASGQQISGMLLEETEDGITLADVKGESRVVLRKDLDELVGNNRSQMPEGLEARLTLQQMADLIAFVANTAAVDGKSSQRRTTFATESLR
jgi:putative heme-binding domain-containing protein